MQFLQGTLFFLPLRSYRVSMNCLSSHKKYWVPVSNYTKPCFKTQYQATFSSRVLNHRLIESRQNKVKGMLELRGAVLYQHLQIEVPLRLIVVFD